MLVRREAPEDFLAQGLGLDALQEVLHDGDVDVRLEEGHAHRAQAVLDVALGDAALAPRLLTASWMRSVRRSNMEITLGVTGTGTAVTRGLR